jgi:pimeloyl-ACP methyl ester carboxylesterase
LYAEIADKLGVEKAYVVGASEGGFIGTNYALHSPERVEKLVLLGPMGYAGTTESVVRIMIVTFFPLKPIRDNTIPWAFGDDPKMVDAFGEWFQLLMAGVIPKRVRPTTFTAEQRQSLKVPVLLILGEKDNLVGDPEIARAKVQDIPDIRVEVLGTGHLIGAEQPQRVNELIIEFFE